ncbi:MAG TPA: hypothetical protein VHY48_04895 [Acidobacteriaceae bacterium]|jgi:hypothetical protein|nr:hypothetical protein [Acidobacteriaceae bacterium]
MHRLASLALALSLFAAPALPAQTPTPAPQQPANSTNSSKPTKHWPPKPRAEAAPGGGPGMVWVNTTSKVYHCPGDRYYGKTANGKYMTEKEARSFGAHGSRNETCFAK